MTLHRLHRCQFSERNWKLTYFINLIRTLFCSLPWFFVAIVVLEVICYLGHVKKCNVNADGLSHQRWRTSVYISSTLSLTLTECYVLRRPQQLTSSKCHDSWVMTCTERREDQASHSHCDCVTHSDTTQNSSTHSCWDEALNWHCIRW